MCLTNLLFHHLMMKNLRLIFPPFQHFKHVLTVVKCVRKFDLNDDATVVFHWNICASAVDEIS